MNFGMITLNQSTETKQSNATLDTDSFIIHIKTKDFYKDIAYDFEKVFDTSNYKVDRPLPRGMNKKVI